MTHLRHVVLPLRMLLAVVFTALVPVQVWAVPAVLPDLADPSLEQSAVRVTMVVAAVVALACVQVVVACTWQLLSLVTDDRIFSAGAMPWVDAIVRAVTVGWAALLVAFVCSYHFVVDGVDDGPALPVLLLLLLLVGAVVGLLVVVMRALLRQATTLSADLDAVI